MTYTVHQAEEANLEQVVCSVWQRNLEISTDPAKRFHWSHRLTPAGSCATFLLNHHTSGGPEIVGSTTIFPRQLRVLGQELSGGILGDVAVDRAHRTLFPALALQRAARAFARSHIGVLYGLPNRLALPLYERLRFARLGEMVRYSLPLRLEDSVPLDTPLYPLLRPVVRLFDQTRAAWGRVNRLRLPAGYGLQWLERPDERFDELWERGSRAFAIIGRRDGAFLRWRFCEKPDETFRFAALLNQERLEGYAVLQFQDRVASLRDLFAADDKQLQRLLLALIPELREQRLRSLTFRFLGAPWLLQLLQRHGFISREESWPVVIELGEDVPVARDILLDGSQWYLTDADEDT